MDEVHSEHPAKAQVYLAAERTLLAWIRTSIAMMGLGFIVARFGLFLREIRHVEDQTEGQVGFSLLVGVSIIILGVGLVIAAAFAHVRTYRRISQNQPIRFSAYSVGLVVAVILAAIGLILSVSLIFLSLQEGSIAGSAGSHAPSVK